ncbi:hypothetical protein [Mycobacteroides chelonae]|uniref:hypothetical protein n=1 Tax=Mycobacteroides chelonae TaxID=1774 RepID=UPI00104248D8|nr:hypothetical protein [Mycobacteroides chelonae]
MTSESDAHVILSDIRSTMLTAVDAIVVEAEGQVAAATTKLDTFKALQKIIRTYDSALSVTLPPRDLRALESGREDQCPGVQSGEDHGDRG